MCLEVGPEGWHRSFASLFGGVTEGGMCSALLLLPTLCFESSSEVAVGFVWLLLLLFGLFVSFVQNFPQLCMHALIFTPL